ncbi:MAG: hypothetical protein ACRDTV_04970, partial [Mycobacterium sp.]
VQWSTLRLPVFDQFGGPSRVLAAGLAHCATADKTLLLLCIVARFAPLNRAATCRYPTLTDSAGGIE